MTVAASTWSNCVVTDFALWKTICGVSAEPKNADEKARQTELFLRWKTEKRTYEHWFGVDSVSSSFVDETTSRIVAQFFDVVGLGDVTYFENSLDCGLCSCSRAPVSPGEKKRRCFIRPHLLKKILGCQCIINSA